MRWSDVVESLKDFWFEYRRQKVGMLGLTLLLLFIALAIVGPRFYPAEMSRKWRDVTYWQNYPRSARPNWINYFSSHKMPPHLIITEYNASERMIGAKIREFVATFEYDYHYDEPPSDLILTFRRIVEDPAKPPTMTFIILRPDGREIELISKKLSEAGNETRIVITSDRGALSTAYAFGREFETPENLEKVHFELTNPALPLFSKAQPGILLGNKAEPLKGTYTIRVTFYFQNPEDKVEDLTLIMGGRVYGLLGTDENRRDLFAGLIWGTRVSLLIGILTSALSVSFGIFYGVMSAYLGGWKDEILQRIYEIMSSIPTLPILILLSAIYKPSIWWIIFFLVVFGWMGTSRMARSMAYQIKEMDYVEAARAVGATGFWIVRKHVMPQILPYAFASMALSVPSAILTEAGLSFLGLGDINRVTWGQILHDAQSTAATIKGMWWWVLPPGLAMALLGLSFAFIGAALNTILFPKLRRL